MIQIGDKAIFAFEIGDKLGEQVQIVDIWADSVLLTNYDNQVYLPQFIHSLKFELNEILKGNIEQDYAFLHFGPTTDGVIARAVVNQDFSFLKIEVVESGQVLSVTLQTSALISYYRECIKVLVSNAT